MHHLELHVDHNKAAEKTCCEVPGVVSWLTANNTSLWFLFPKILIQFICLVSTVVLSFTSSLPHRKMSSKFLYGFVNVEIRHTYFLQLGAHKESVCQVLLKCAKLSLAIPICFSCCIFLPFHTMVLVWDTWEVQQIAAVFLESQVMPFCLVRTADIYQLK